MSTITKGRTVTSLILCRTKSETVWQPNSALDGSCLNRMFSLNTVNIFMVLKKNKIYIENKFCQGSFTEVWDLCLLFIFTFVRMINYFWYKNLRSYKETQVAGPTRGSSNTTKAGLSVWNQSLLRQRHACLLRRASWETIIHERTSCRAMLTACIDMRARKNLSVNRKVAHIIL